MGLITLFYYFKALSFISDKQGIKIDNKNLNLKNKNKIFRIILNNTILKKMMNAT